MNKPATLATIGEELKRQKAELEPKDDMARRRNRGRLAVAADCQAAAEIYPALPRNIQLQLDATMEELFTRFATTLLGVEVVE